MKKTTLILALLFALTANAYATDIILSGQQTTQIPFNPSNLGNTRTITVTATNGSASVTSSAAFPTAIVGKSGFTISIGGVFYTVAAVQSTSSLTLTKAFTGTTGSTSLLLYPYTLFRAFPTAGFQSSTVTSTTATIAVVNGSATVTSAALFPAMYTGVAGGYQVLIDGVPYQVLWQASTSSLVLTQTYGGTTGAATMTFDGVAENVQPSAPGGQWFKEVAVSVVNLGAGNVLYYPPFVMPATTNATVNNQARYVFVFYRPDNSQLAIYQCGAQSQLAIPTSTPTTWTAICSFNSPGGVVPPNTEVYTKSQIDQRFPACVAGQSYYFATNGQAVSCLNFGSGLTLTGNTLTAPGGGGSVTDYRGAINVSKAPYSCAGDGITNDTACIAAALTAAFASTGKQVYFPAGTYLTDPITQIIQGINIIGDGPRKSIIKARVANNPVFNVDGPGETLFVTIEELGIYGQGKASGSAGHCAVFGSLTPDNEAAFFTIRNVDIMNCGGKGLYMPGQFTTLIEGVTTDEIGDNHIEIQGGNTTTLVRNYVRTVEAGKVGYRIQGGDVTLIGNNGIDGDSDATALWGIFGSEFALDGRDSYFRGTLNGNNIESYGTQGLDFRTDSYATFSGNAFTTNNDAGTHIAVRFRFIDPANAQGVWNGNNRVILAAGSYANGAAIHSRGVPFMQIGSAVFTSYYDTSIGTLITLPTIVNSLVAGSANSAATFSRARITAMESSGLVGDLTGATSFLGTAARTVLQDGTAGRPVYTNTTNAGHGMYFPSGTGVGLAVNQAQKLDLTTTNHTLTGNFGINTFGNGTYALDVSGGPGRIINTAGGSTPTLGLESALNTHLLVTDSGGAFPIIARLGTLQGGPDRAFVGTMSTHPFDLYQDGTRRWTVDSLGDFVPNGQAVYQLGNTINPALSTHTRFIELHNTTNNNSTILESTSLSQITISMFPDLPVSGSECVQISSAGALTRTGSACGSGGGTIAGSGSVGTISKFVTNTTTIGDSLLTESGSTITTAGRQTINGLTISTDATNTVASLTANATFTKNNSNPRDFFGVLIKPTFNFGGSNSATIVNILEVDSVNTSVTGLTTNLLSLKYGGNIAFNVDSDGGITFASGIRQAFAPSTIVASLNVGQVAADPSSPVNGDMVYETNTNKFRCYENSAWVDCISSGANTALSNLASVAINTSLLSDTTLTDDLGSASFYWRRAYAGQYFADATITSPGTTGNQTINKSLFSINFGIGSSSVIVTNSMITTSSLVVCTPQKKDTTLLTVAAEVSSGSVNLIANAGATAETKVACIVYNQ